MLRRYLAFLICPSLRDEIHVLQSGNTKVVLENGLLLDRIANNLTKDEEIAAVGINGLISILQTEKSVARDLAEIALAGIKEIRQTNDHNI